MARAASEEGALVAVIADEDTITGFLLAGVGDVDLRKRTNFLVVDGKTTVRHIEASFKDFTARDDVAIVLISQPIANMIRHVIANHNKVRGAAGRGRGCMRRGSVGARASSALHTGDERGSVTCCGSLLELDLILAGSTFRAFGTGRPKLKGQQQLGSEVAERRLWTLTSRHAPPTPSTRSPSRRCWRSPARTAPTTPTRCGGCRVAGRGTLRRLPRCGTGAPAAGLRGRRRWGRAHPT